MLAHGGSEPSLAAELVFEIGEHFAVADAAAFDQPRDDFLRFTGGIGEEVFGDAETVVAFILGQLLVENVKELPE